MARRTRLTTALVSGVLLASGLLAAPAQAAPAPLAASSPAAVAAAAYAPWRVSPGRIGDLRMGTRTSVAKAGGWIARTQCGWDAGPRAYQYISAGEVYKAYPDKVANRRVWSFQAWGVKTTKGIRTEGLSAYPRPGSHLRAVKLAYPNLKRVGSFHDHVSGEQMPIFSAGNRTRGWLDFYIRPDTRTVRFVQVRAHGVKPGEPRFGC